MILKLSALCVVALAQFVKKVEKLLWLSILSIKNLFLTA